MSEYQEERLQEEENALCEKVAMLCQMYGGSAKNVGSSDFSADEEINQHDLNRYETARKTTLGIELYPVLLTLA